MTHVLLIDPDPARRALLQGRLSAGGLAVEVVSPEGVSAAVGEGEPEVAAVVAETRRAPLALLRRLGALAPDLPVLILGVPGDARAEVEALEAGAADYVADALGDSDVLLARIRARLRQRPPAGVPSALTFRDMQLDVGARIARRGQREIPLSPVEFHLLLQFMRQHGRVLSKQALREGQRDIGVASDNAVEVNVARLRKKLEAAGEPRLIHTVYGLGYILRG